MFSAYLNYTRAKLQGCSFLRKKSRTLCIFASGTACYFYIKLYQNEKTPGENSPRVAIYQNIVLFTSATRLRPPLESLQVAAASQM